MLKLTNLSSLLINGRIYGKILGNNCRFCAGFGHRRLFVDGGWRNLIMILIALVLLFLAIKKDSNLIYFCQSLSDVARQPPFVASEVFLKGSTAYNSITLAANVGITSQQSDYIFEQFAVC